MSHIQVIHSNPRIDTQVAHGRTRVAQIGGLGQDLSIKRLARKKVAPAFSDNSRINPTVARGRIRVACYGS